MALFQMHLKLDNPAALVGLADLEDAFLAVEDTLLEHRVSGQFVDDGAPVGFWSITDADDDPRIARVRAIAANIRDGNPANDDIAQALLKAIDGNPQEVQDAPA